MKELEEQLTELRHKNKNIKKNRNYVVKKLGRRTKSLWFAAGVISDNNLTEYGNDQEKVYSMLKIIGETLYEDDQLKERIKQEQEGEK